MSRATLYRKRDFAVRLGHAGCRVSIVRCTDALAEALARWAWPAAERRRDVEAVLGPHMAHTIANNAFLKGEERTQAILSSGTAALAMAEASRTGEVRARFLPEAAPSLVAELGATLGLDVRKVLYNMEKPFTSSVQLEQHLAVAAGIDDAVDAAWGHFYAQSEQIPTKVVSKTVVDETGRVRLCAALAVQGLVETPRSRALAEGAADNYSEDVELDYSPADAVERLWQELSSRDAKPALDGLAEQVHGAEWWNAALGLQDERFAAKLSVALGVQDREELFSAGSTEFATRCEYCNAEHVITKSLLDQADAKLASAHGSPSSAAPRAP